MSRENYERKRIALYCLCGAAEVWNFGGGEKTVAEKTRKINEVWAAHHSGAGHGVTDPATARRVRNTAERQATKEGK